MSSPQIDSIVAESSAPPAQAPAAAAEQGRLPDLGSCADAQKPPDPSTPTALDSIDSDRAPVAAAAAAEQERLPLASPQLDSIDPKSSAPPAQAPAAAAAEQRRLPWLRTTIKLAFWPVRRVFDGVGLAGGILVGACRRPIVVRCVTKASSLVPDPVRRSIYRVAMLFDDDPLPHDPRDLPMSDPLLERLYFRPDMVRIGLVLFAGGVVLFVTMEVLIMAGAITRYEEYFDILKKFLSYLQFLLDAAAKVYGFYSNLKWHRAEVARKREDAKQQLPPPAAELLIQTPPPPEMDIC